MTRRARRGGHRALAGATSAATAGAEIDEATIGSAASEGGAGDSRHTASGAA